jgi:Fe-S cluster assembly scaffold protein SufB
MDTNIFKVNRIPSLTWNWLHMNEASVDRIPQGTDSDILQDIHGNVESGEEDGFSITGIRTGMGDNITTLVENSGIKIKKLIGFEKTEKEHDGIARLTFDFEEDSINGLELIAEEKSDFTVVMNYNGPKDQEISACVQTRYQVKKGAKLTLIQINRLGENFSFMNDLGGTIAEDGTFQLIQLVLGGKNNYYGNFTSLEGKKSHLISDMGYLLNGDSNLDINTVADHTGKKTLSDINVSGVLRDNSQKTFRGTIDFHRGCGGAKGNELENVLLMDEDVINRTIPVILCDEEDVEGNHGASIGKIDEDLLFYMQSRGMDETAIYEMMAKARVDSVIRLIPDEETRASFE